MLTARGGPADPTRGHRVHDHEIDDAPGSPPSHSGAWRAAPSLRSYQRLLANPFLAMLGLVAWFVVVRQTVALRRLDFFVPAVLSLGLVGFLFQYHCLDCGATGRLWRWRDHACEAVRRRHAAGRMTRLRALTPVGQTLAWFYLLILVAALVFILRSAPR